MMRGFGVAAAVVVVMSAAPACAQEHAVAALVERFEAARTAFDPAALAATLAPDYEEISPLGQVDTRDRVVGFYTADKKRAAPPLRTDEVSVRMYRDAAVMTARKSFDVSGAPTRSLRVRYIARRSGNEWRLVSAQYTPIHATH